MLKIYLAARHSRRLELCGYRDTLNQHNIAVTSRWLDDINGASVPTVEDRRRLAQEEQNDIGKCDLLAAFLDEKEQNDIGKCDLLAAFLDEKKIRADHHTAVGIALGRRKRIAIVGPRANVFYWLPSVQQFPDFATLLQHLLKDKPA